MQQGHGDLPHVQADELWVKLVSRRVRMAMATAVPSRLWLGSVISPHRNLVLIATLVQLVRSCAGSLAILVGVDGLATYVTAFRRVFRHPVRPGHRGRPRLVREPGLLIGHVVKRYVHRRVVNVERRVVQGAEAALAPVPPPPVVASTGINTASSEPAQRHLPRLPGAPGEPRARHRPHRAHLQQVQGQPRDFPHSNWI